MLALNSDLLLEKSVAESLFTKLVGQLNKDFLLANLEEQFHETISPEELKEKLKTVLVKLIATNYDGYLNLLYRIDVSEKELSQIQFENMNEAVDQISFVILKREFQKVWFKSKL
ncbi:hypothetical protein [Lutibacter sp.]|uniref:hypothetical protein n=1 Tax=Lutibacter sp. TaxID=1925666 RepID=UPI0027373401|nr:hypothetical protein [Lutibacter sp.]MDP3313615.1 hypothetical protein [Lutibacter sp.]